MLRPVLDPKDPPRDPSRRRKARLLSAFLLVLAVVFGLVDATSLVVVPGYVPPWYGYAFLAARGCSTARVATTWPPRSP